MKLHPGMTPEVIEEMFNFCGIMHDHSMNTGIILLLTITLNTQMELVNTLKMLLHAGKQ